MNISYLPIGQKREVKINSIEFVAYIIKAINMVANWIHTAHSLQLQIIAALFALNRYFIRRTMLFCARRYCRVFPAICYKSDQLINSPFSQKFLVF